MPTAKAMNIAKKLEENKRHASMHAAAIAITPTPLTDYTPLQQEPDGERTITQYDMYSAEDAGLLKFDFLGIRNLAILADAISLVKKFYGAKIDLDRIPLDDKKTFALLANS